MTLIPGDIGATTGMAEAIYAQIQGNIEPDMPDMEDIEAVRDGWRKLAHAVATGVVAHIQANLELLDAATNGTPVRNVDGVTDADPGGGNHTHAAGTLSVTLNNLSFE